MEARETSTSSDREVERILAEHGAQLISVARAFSATPADAEDAFQSACVVMLTRRPADLKDPLAWCIAVVRNEALMIGRRNRRQVEGEFERIVERLAADGPIPEDRVLANHASGLAREALQRLNPDQARCLLLRADGLTYVEISRYTGFSLPKVKRCLSEGRRVARGFVDRIDSGAECQRMHPLLVLAADNEIAGDQRAELEVHLSNCEACQATLREYVTMPRDLSSLAPLGTALLAERPLREQVARWFESAFSWLHERLVSPAQMHYESLTTVRRAAVVTVLAATAVGSAGTAKFAVDSMTARADWGPRKTAQALPRQSSASVLTKESPEAAPAAAITTGEPLLGEDGDLLDQQAPTALQDPLPQTDEPAPDVGRELTDPPVADPGPDADQPPTLPDPAQ